MTWALWVRHPDVEAHLRLGWMVTVPREIVCHDHWAVLLVWLCDCDMRRPG